MASEVTMNPILLFLGVEAVSFAAASLVHAGVLLDGYQHFQASVAEGVIAVVLVLGLVAGAVSARGIRVAGLAAPGFALLGTCVGMVMIAIGVGPQSRFDVALHAGFVTLLAAGLAVTLRRRTLPAGADTMRPSHG
jgi:ABC-type uncharacterized transport system permease subunit